MGRRGGSRVEVPAAESPAIFKFVRGLGVVPAGGRRRQWRRGRPRHPRDPLALRSYWEYLLLRPSLELLHLLARFGPPEWFEAGLRSIECSQWGPVLDKVGRDIVGDLRGGKSRALAIALIARRRHWRHAKVRELIREGRRLDREWASPSVSAKARTPRVWTRRGSRGPLALFPIAPVSRLVARP
jgi:hypothetical protein